MKLAGSLANDIKPWLTRQRCRRLDARQTLLVLQYYGAMYRGLQKSRNSPPSAMAHFRSLRPCEFDLWPFVDSITFYHTTHIQHTWCVPRGVHLSVRHKPVFCPSTAHDCSLVFWHKNLAKIPMWSPNAGAKYTLTRKVCDFLPTTRQISETAQLGTDTVCYGKWIRRWYMLHAV